MVRLTEIFDLRQAVSSSRIVALSLLSQAFQRGENISHTPQFGDHTREFPIGILPGSIVTVADCNDLRGSLNDSDYARCDAQRAGNDFLISCTAPSYVSIEYCAGA